MQPIIELRKTGYYVTEGNGRGFQDVTGHGWFSKQLAREYAAELGGMYYEGNRTTIKEVVTGYTDAEN